MELAEQIKFHREEAHRLSCELVNKGKEKFGQFIGKCYKYNRGVMKIESIEYIYEDEESRADVIALYAKRTLDGKPYFNSKDSITIEFNRISGEVSCSEFSEFLLQISEEIKHFSN